MSEAKPTPVLWKPGKCNVPMWAMGAPSGFCLQPANGPQLPQELLGWATRPYCHGHCCPSHGGPQDGEPIVFQDGCTEEGRPMWCAVMPDFVNLHESPAGFSGSAIRAVSNLRAALSKARPNTAEGEAQAVTTNSPAEIVELLECSGCLKAHMKERALATVTRILSAQHGGEL